MKQDIFTHITHFVTPVVIDHNSDERLIAYRKFIDAYLSEKDGVVDPTKLEMHYTERSEELDKFYAVKGLDSTYEVDGRFVYVLDVTKWKDDIEKIVEGLYSDVSDSYKNYFKAHGLYTQDLVFSKSPIVWEEYWGPMIGTDAPEGAQMWSKPFNYIYTKC